MAVRRLTLFGYFVLLGVAGCRPAKPAPAAPPPPTVTVAVPGKLEVQNYYEYNGYLAPKEMVEIKARVRGFLTDVHFKDGDEVDVGTPLYLIEQAEFMSAVSKSKADIARAEADIAASKAQVALGEVEYTRLRLGGTGVAKSEVDKAVANLAAAKAQQDVAEANKRSAEAALRTAELQLSYTDIKSPIKGLISNTKVTKGNLVGLTDSTLLTTIVSIDPIHVYFDVPERDWIEYQQQQKDRVKDTQAPKKVELELGLATEEGFPHKGFIDFSDNRAETTTGTVRIRGQLDNPKVGTGQARLLFAGLFSRVRVPSGKPAERFIIPEEALMTGQEGRFVFVVGPENKVQKRSVKLGIQVWRAAPMEDKDAPRWTMANLNPPKEGDATTKVAPLRSLVAIESGLQAGDLVIVNGLQKARPGAPVNPERWEIRSPQAPKK